MRQDPEFLRNFIVVLRENQSLVWNKTMDAALTDWINAIRTAKTISLEEVCAKDITPEDLIR
jgi:hypothetical protein